MNKDCFLIIIGTSFLNLLVGVIMMLATGDPMNIVSFAMPIFWSALIVLYVLRLAWDVACDLILRRNGGPQIRKHT